MEELDAIVFDQIRGLRYEKETRPETGREPDIKKEIAKQQKKLRRLLDLYTDGKMPLEMVNAKTEEINAAIRSLEDELNKPKPQTLQEVQTELADFSDILDGGDFDEIRFLLTQLIDKLVITNDDLDFYWNFSD